MKILDPHNVLSCWMYVKTLLNEMYLYLEIFLFGMKLKYILKVYLSTQFICVAYVRVVIVYKYLGDFSQMKFFFSVSFKNQTLSTLN